MFQLAFTYQKKSRDLGKLILNSRLMVGLSTAYPRDIYGSDLYFPLFSWSKRHVMLMMMCCWNGQQRRAARFKLALSLWALFSFQQLEQTFTPLCI